VRTSLLTLAVATAIAAWSAMSLPAATINWTHLAGSAPAWNTNANPPWDTATFPDTAGDVANLGVNITATQSISLNQLITIGGINIGDTSGSSTQTIAPGTGGSLVFDNGGSDATLNRVAAGTGNSTISAPITLNDNLAIDNASASSLLLSGAIDGSGKGITVTGAGLTSIVQLRVANTYTGDTTVTSGALALGNSAAAGTGNIILNGGALGTVNTGAAEVTHTVANPIQVNADSFVTAVGTTSAATRAHLELTGPISGSAKMTFDSGTSSSSVNTGAIYVYDDLTNFTGVMEVNHRDTTSGGTGSRTMGTLRFLAPAAASVTYGGLSVQDYSANRFEFNGAINFASNGVSTRVNDEETVGTSDVMVVQIGELSGDGGFLLTNGGTSATYQRTVLEVGHLGTDVSFEGGMRGSLTDFVKVGSGSLTLSGRNAFTGTTTIRGGELILADDASNVNLSANGDDIMGDGIFDNTMTANASTDFLTYATVVAGIDTLGTIQELQDGDRVSIGYGSSIGLSASAEWYVRNASGSGLSRTFQLSATPAGAIANITAAGSSVRVYPLSTLGADYRPIEVGDTGSATGHLATGASETVGLLTSAAVTVARPINVNNVGAGTTLGGTTDDNSFFTGDVVLGKEVMLSSVTTGSNTVTFSGELSGLGAGVIKVGSGSVTLTEFNTYTGDTSIEEGNLILSQAYLADTANVLLDSSALLTLGFNDIDLVGALSFDGMWQPAGTHGAIGSGADWESALFSGPGMLLVVPEPSSIALTVLSGMVGLAIVRRGRRREELTNGHRVPC
jgi:fibronectin-binding autotransporter adhesin